MNVNLNSNQANGFKGGVGIKQGGGGYVTHYGGAGFFSNKAVNEKRMSNGNTANFYGGP